MSQETGFVENSLASPARCLNALKANVFFLLANVALIIFVLLITKYDATAIKWFALLYVYPRT